MRADFKDKTKEKNPIFAQAPPQHKKKKKPKFIRVKRSNVY